MMFRKLFLALLVAGTMLWGQDARQARGVPRTHLVLRFRSSPNEELRLELARRDIRVLGALPGHGLLVSAGQQSSLEGFDLESAAPVAGKDKLSPLLETFAPAAYLIIFHTDTDMSRIRQAVAEAGLNPLDNPFLLPTQLLAAGGPTAISAVASWDEVAYILPASSDLIAGAPVIGCSGPLTDFGPLAPHALAQYSEVGHGWPKDSSGVVSLQYVLQSVAAQLDQNAARGEIERAFREWQRYANIAISAGDQAAAGRTIAIKFARGAHGDSSPFDGRGAILGHTFYPSPLNSEPIAGDMHLDADENWNIGTDLDLFSVVLHETGHALGLGHSDRPGAVMYPYYRLASGLTADDIAGIRDLYGANEGQPSSSNPATPPVTPPVTPPAAPPTPAKPASGDSSAPTLQILSPGGTIVATSAASIRIGGTAADNIGIAAIKWTTSNGDAGVASGTTTWSATIPLLVGTTAVTVRAYDAAGNSAWRAITVVRR